MAQEWIPAILKKKTSKAFQAYKPCEFSHCEGQHRNPDRVSKVNAKPRYILI